MRRPFARGLLIAFLAVLLLAGGSVLLADSEKGTPQSWPEALEQYIGEPAYKSVDPDKPLHEQTSVFEIAGRTFEMPTVYIQSNIKGKRELDGINLLYVLPDFTSRADFSTKEEYDRAFRERRFGHMLIQVGSGRPSLDRMVANRRQGTPRIDSAQLRSGLATEHWYSPQDGRLTVTKEHYFERDADGHIVNWIECSTKERLSVRFPGCNHRFRDKGLLYDIYYNKMNYLDSWREQRSSAINFIDSFQIASSDISNKGGVAEWPQALKADLGARTYARIDFSRPLNEQVATVRLAHRTFRIPIAYSPTDLERDDLTAIVLNYVLPDYTSRASFSSKEQYEDARDNGRFGQILLRPEDETFSLDQIIDQRRRYIQKVTQGKSLGEMESEDWYRLDKGEFILTTRAYLHRDDDGHITDLILCGPFSHPYVKSQECSHKFFDDRFLYELTYSMERHLSDWRSQRRSAIEFIDDLEILPENITTRGKQ